MNNSCHHTSKGHHCKSLSFLLICMACVSIQVSIAADAPSVPGGRILFDVTPPTIEHTPFSQPQQANNPITIEAIITDNQGIQSVILNYRVKGMQSYRRLNMSLSETNSSAFLGTIPGSDVNGDAIEYYIQATDTGGNTILRGGTLFPLTVAIAQPPKSPTPMAAAPNTPKSPKVSGLFELPDTKATWAWIAGGVLVGALIANNNKDDDNSSSKPKGTINISASGVER